VRRTAAIGTILAALVLAGGCTSSGPTKTPTHVSGRQSSIETISLPPDTASASPNPPAARTATVLGSGDVLIHPPLWQQAHRDAQAEGKRGYDFAPMYASIAPDVRDTDLATCEMETPLAPPQGPFAGWPDFSAPPQVLTALTGVGYRTCTTASNHSLDQGYDGLKRTLDELDSAGLRHTGSARSGAEASRPLIVKLPNGVKIGQLAYSFGFNGIPVPSDKPWIANLIDVPEILAAAKQLKQAGADIVVLSMHWGTEYDHLATQEQRDQARRLLKSPNIDLILGDHAHVVQPAEKIHGKWVFYCMGNQISRHADPIPEGRQGLMPRVTFTEVSSHHFKVSSAEAIPTWMEDEPKLRLIDLPRALASSSLTATQRTADRQAHAAIAGYLDAYGAVKDGLEIR
jgi:poly-gamma-glutamate capsule biosynthesis protein CapA/YwtB (metallophosphatase superfamily)